MAPRTDPTDPAPTAEALAPAAPRTASDGAGQTGPGAPTTPAEAPARQADPATGTTPPAPPLPGLLLASAHRRRLREVWRSAGWPCRDGLEAELLAAGLLARALDGDGRETLRVTDAGVAEIARTLQRNRAARDAHEALVGRVAREMQRHGRIVWRGLSLRARVAPDGGDPDGRDDAAWVMAMPDVYSIRHTTVEDYVEPIAHEVKVRRADLLADLKRPAKGAAYRWLSSECWYVLRAGIARPDEVPEPYGVLLAQPGGALEVARPAPRRGLRLPFAVWMALARATPEAADDDAQGWLGGPAGP